MCSYLKNTDFELVKLSNEFNGIVVTSDSAVMDRVKSSRCAKQTLPTGVNGQKIKIQEALYLNKIVNPHER